MFTDLTDVLSVIRVAESYLIARGVPNARRNAEWILAHVLECPSQRLYLAPSRLLERRELDAYDVLLQRRGEREPLQYVLGSTEFMSLRFHSVRGVFIPRPDTEVLVEKVETLLSRRLEWRSAGAVGDGTSARILDLCCGTGAIGIALTCRLPQVHTVAVDIDERAVEVTRQNAELNGVPERIRCVRADAFEFLHRDPGVYDVVVCNPPYVRTGEIERLPPEIKDHEPPLSLDGGADGLDFYRRLAPLLGGAVRPGGIVAFEIGDTLGMAVAETMSAASFGDIEIHTDYAGLKRVVTAVKP